MGFSPILAIHVTAGMIGMFSGTAALIFRKGSSRHALSGTVFVVSMLVMAAGAVYLAVLKNQPDNVGGGILTLYLITTAWLTAKRRDGQTQIYDWGLLLVPLWIGVLSWTHGLQSIRNHTVSQQGVLPVFMGFFMGSLMLLAAAGDLRMLVRHGVFGTQRIVRHLWRMCLGLFIATGSFFLGQGSKIFGPFWRQSPLLIIPAVLPLFLLLFWLFRVRFSAAYKRMFPPVIEAPTLHS
jgi:hypothetical protein